MRSLILFILIPFVAHADGLCQTECGLLAAVSASAACDALQAAEGAAVAALEKYARLPAAQSCAALGGWMVSVRKMGVLDIKNCDGGSFWLESGEYPAGGFCAGGYTHLESAVIEVASEDFRRNSLAHELVHVIRGVGHCQWSELGIKAAISSVTGRPERVRSDCDD